LERPHTKHALKTRQTIIVPYTIALQLYPGEGQFKEMYEIPRDFYLF